MSTLPTTPAQQQRNLLAASAFEHYGEDLHRFLVRRLPRSEDARDVMQEVFLRLLRLQRHELVRNPQAYLYGIASRVLREFQALQRDNRVIFDSQTLDHHAEHTANSPLNADPMAETVDIEKRLERGLKLLTPLQSQIFLLERCSRLSQEEIARRLGISPHTVKKYASQALALIRAHWKRADEQA